MHSVMKIDNPLREERLQRFIELLRANWSYAANKLEMEAVIAFVSSDQTAQPVISMPWCYADILTLLNDNPEYWNAYDDRLMRFITKKRHWQSGSYDGFAYYFYHHWLTPKLQANPKRPFFETLTTRLVQYGSSEASVVERICEMASPFFVVNGQVSGVGEYAVGRIEPFFASVYKTSDSASLLDLLLRSAPTVADKHLLRLLEVSSDYADEFTINATCVRVLLERDARRYEPLVAKLLPKLTYHENLSAVLSVLTELVPATYGGREVEQAYWYFDTLRKQAGRTTSQLMYTAEYDPKLQKYVPVYQTHLGHLLDLEEPAKAWNYLLNWLNDVVYYPVDMLPPIVDRYGQGSVGLLMTWLKTGADPFNQYIAQYHRTSTLR